mmetsp:Transcript_50296/g.112993  ORF Transcript_50296/g.112993 Transcript_50296/m.112993 type:complete len:216 (-) Transcript_50296:139-786(-)
MPLAKQIPCKWPRRRRRPAQSFVTNGGILLPLILRVVRPIESRRKLCIERSCAARARALTVTSGIKVTAEYHEPIVLSWQSHQIATQVGRKCARSFIRRLQRSTIHQREVGRTHHQREGRLVATQSSAQEGDVNGIPHERLERRRRRHPPLVRRPCSLKMHWATRARPPPIQHPDAPVRVAVRCELVLVPESCAQEGNRLRVELLAQVDVGVKRE